MERSASVRILRGSLGFSNRFIAASLATSALTARSTCWLLSNASSYQAVKRVHRSLSTRSQPNQLVTPRQAVDVSTPAARAPSAANPPASTRPPPLDLPVKQPETSTLSHLLATGKAYLTFYKTGLKQIYINTRLVYGEDPGRLDLDSSQPGSTEERKQPRGASTRSWLLLRHRWRHDIRCLPIFALMLLICGEFTPFVVVFFPSIVPFTCRMPSQQRKLQGAIEKRRADSWQLLATLRSGDPAVAGAKGVGLSAKVQIGHISRSLGLVSTMWDRLGMWPPKLVSARAVRHRIAFLVEDDILLEDAGGVPALESEEVRLACADRGIDVLDRSERELEDALAHWLRLTGNGDPSSRTHRARRVQALLLLPQSEWPSTVKGLDMPADS